MVFKKGEIYTEEWKKQQSERMLGFGNSRSRTQGDFSFLPIYCQCPCHEPIQLNKERIKEYECKGYPKFINHHNRRGITISDEIRKNMSDAQKIAQNKSDVKKKNSESHIGLQSGEKHPMYGKHHSEKTKEVLRQKRLAQECPTLGKHWEMPEEWKIWNQERMKGEGNSMFGMKGELCPSSKRIGELNPMFGISHTDEWKEHNSKKISGEKNGMFGKHQTPEAKKKNSEAHSGENNSN
jgi:hypothetical protein